MARPLYPPPLLVVWPLVDELFFAASLGSQNTIYTLNANPLLPSSPLIQGGCKKNSTYPLSSDPLPLSLLRGQKNLLFSPF